MFLLWYLGVGLHPNMVFIQAARQTDRHRHVVTSPPDALKRLSQLFIMDGLHGNFRNSSKEQLNKSSLRT